MTSVAQELSDEEIEALAHYLAHLPSTELAQ
jgi:cytochrome c553